MTYANTREPEHQMHSKSVRELARERGTTENGRILAPGDSRAAIKARKPGSAPTPRKSFLEAGFRMRQRVSIVRDEHNYYDGAVEGTITYLTDHECVVTGEDGMKYYIYRAGNIWPA
jgi:hypothetical protein